MAGPVSVENIITNARHDSSQSHSAVKWIELLEAVVLALVAVATAASSFQAAKWSGLSARSISFGLNATVLAQQKVILAGQDHLYDVVTFNAWLQAKMTRNPTLVALYERRFRPEYATAFAAWLKIDPFHNPSAPPGPMFMDEYKNAKAEESSKLNEQANAFFEEAATARKNSEEYLRTTVLLAMVLLLTVIAQRIQSYWPQAGIIAAACILLLGSVYYLSTLPRIW
jgi:hypothetical protein